MVFVCVPARNLGRHLSKDGIGATSETEQLMGTVGYIPEAHLHAADGQLDVTAMSRGIIAWDKPRQVLAESLHKTRSHDGEFPGIIARRRGWLAKGPSWGLWTVAFCGG